MSEHDTTNLSLARWLDAVADWWRPQFAEAGYPLPENVRVQVGWPAGGTRSTATVDAVAGDVATDGAVNVWLTPRRGDVASVDVILDVAKGLCMTAGARSEKRLERAMTRVGMIGPLANDCRVDIEALVAAIGPLPFGALDLDGGRRKQTARQRLVTCATCGYKARVARSWLRRIGPPYCGTVEHGPMAEGEAEGE